MPNRPRERLASFATAFGCLALCSVLIAAAASSPSQAQPGVSKLYAVYKVNFAGMKLGKFRAWAEFSGNDYSIRSKTNLELGFIIKGLFFKLDGGAQSTGSVSTASVRPEAYSLYFKTKKTRGHLAMEFDGNSVSRVKFNPPVYNNPKSVPVTKRHVTGVLDPLSAVFIPAAAKNGGIDKSICRQKAAIFDGRHRYNLTLTYKRTVQVKGKRAKGYRGPALICRVKYTPIAGHRPDDEGLRFMQKTQDIEAWFVPVPGTKFYVPYHVSMPTPYGQASATSTVFDVETTGQKKIAVIN
jgi:hypothetical protein